MTWNNWNDITQERAWGYKLGHAAAHFMSWQEAGTSGILISACGQVLMDPLSKNTFIADHTIKKCGRCSRVVKKQPELLGPGAVAGFWDGATGMTSQHHWLAEGEGFKTRCGKERQPDELGQVQPELLADMGVERAGDLPYCKKCSNYLGVDMAKNVPGKQVIRDTSGDLISVELVQATLTADQLGKMVTGGRVLADPVEVYIVLDADNNILPWVEDPFEVIDDVVMARRKVVIIDEVK